MKLKDLFTRFSITDETEQKRIAYLIASFGELYEDSEQDDYVSANDIDYYNNEELGDLFVSNYALESGCYTRGQYFLSLENVIGALTEFERY